MMALPISKAVVLLLLSVAVCMTAAYPQLYVVRVATEDCLSHPSKALGGHQAPTNSSDISISFAPAASEANQTSATPSAAVTSLCAGGNYTVTVAIGNSGNALVTSSTGTLTMGTSAEGGAGSAALEGAEVEQLQQFTAQCPNRVITPSAVDTLQLTLGVPDDATGDLTLRVTMAASRSDGFQQASATIPVTAQCDATGSNTTSTESATPGVTSTGGAAEQPSAGAGNQTASTTDSSSAANGTRATSSGSVCRTTDSKVSLFVVMILLAFFAVFS